MPTSRGIRIVGDIPIFVAMDSSDTWTNPDEFFLDEEYQPTVVAGVPPDYFSATRAALGQPALSLGRDGEERLCVVAAAHPRGAAAL